MTPGAVVSALCCVGAVAACDDERGAGGPIDPCAVCADDARCDLGAGGAATCSAVCAAPRLARVAQLPRGASLPVPAGALVTVSAMGARPGAPERDPSADPSADEVWQSRDTIVFEALGPTAVHARWAEAPAACAGREAPIFEATYAVVEALPGADDADDAGKAPDAVALDDQRIVGWATGSVAPGDFGSDLDPAWTEIAPALGPATGAWDDAVSLGNGGALTFTFDVPIEDGPGFDVAVFENGFTAQFLELGFVEVSSDGEHFARFDALSFQREPIASYGTLDAREVTGVAGRYAGGFGVGFDLAALADHPLVLSGRVDLAALAFVRVVDVVGGVSRDALGATLFDPAPTVGPAGFDVEAIAILGAP